MFSWFMGGDAEAKPIHPAVEKVIADAPELAKYIDQVRTANFSLFLERRWVRNFAHKLTEWECKLQHWQL